jgi:iron(III) transport system substrate-binding protein
MKYIPTRRIFVASMIGTIGAPAILRSQTAKVVNLYSARHYDTDEALYSDFTNATGIAVNRIEAGPEALIERMRAEGVNSPADVFLSVDAGRIERARELGLLAPARSEIIAAAVPAHLRDPENHWFGFSTRARVLMYHTDRTDPKTLSTYEALAGEAFKGKVLNRSSSSIYNQSLTGSILAARGEAATEIWCKGLVANFARAPKGGDTDQIRAVFAGEGDVAIANTYYLGNIIRKSNERDTDLIKKIGVFFPNQNDRGTHVNISGGGLAASAKNRDNAIRFLEYLVSPSAQRFLAEGNDEYPVVSGVAPPSTIARFGTFKADQLNASVFARNNTQALQIMDRASWK